ncbi:hypothetical protein [Pseudomonas phage IR-QUMS-PaBa1-GHS-2021]|nr:hypothetical protein [Pseudomonas phage IR-QUMS-PaBa1-GHS-2021]
MTYSCNPHSRTVKSQNVRTPGMESLRQKFILKILVTERVRCFMDEVNFDMSGEFIRKFITVPPEYTEPETIEQYIQTEVLDIMEAFKQYEENAVYQEDLKALLPYKGHRWHLVSSTDSGVLITVEA